MFRTVTLPSRIRAGLSAAGVLIFAVAVMEPMMAMMARPPQASGNAARGAEIFQRCALCHNADKGGGNGLGPNLFGVVGRKAASLPDFPYSTALKNSKIVWTDDKLKAWVSGPSKVVPGTRMTFPGLTDPRQADDVIAFLHTRR